MIRLIDAFPNFTTGGIFTAMVNPPWATKYNAKNMDIDFFTSYGQKPISPLVSHFLDADGTVSTANISIIAAIVQSRFSEAWKRKFDVLGIAYQPIHNYDMTETRTGTGTDKHTETGTDTLTHSQTVDTTLTVDGTSTETATDTNNLTVTKKDTVERSIYGFDSATASPSEKSVEDITQTDTGTSSDDRDITTHNASTGKDTTAGTDTDVKERSIDITRNDNYTLNRSGNIGVTTSQQMIESEIELWNWDFVKDIFVNVASMLTLNIY